MSPLCTKPARTIRVDPSARDPIASWLDVFVSLLALPRAQRQTIRDELEDHLRSRVDDLVITGTEEHEAVRKAVAELGETAELARSFRAATRNTTTRRFVMAGTLFTALGAGFVVGVATIMGNAPGATPSVNHNAVVHPGSMPATIQVRDTTYADLFETIRKSADRPLLVHWDRLEGIEIHPDDQVGLDVEPISHHRVYTLLRERGQREWGDMIAVAESDDLLEITTQSHIDQRTTELRTYDVRDLLEAYQSQNFSASADLLDALAELCSPDDWTKRGGDLARSRITGNVLFVEAPERIQEDVGRVLMTLRKDIDRSRAEHHAALQESIAERRQQHAAREHELENLVTEYSVLRERYWHVIKAQKSPTAGEGERAGMHHEQARLEIEIEMTEKRIDHLQGILLDLEFNDAALSKASPAPRAAGRGQTGK